MIIADNHEGLYFSDKVVHKLHFHLYEVVPNIFVHFLDFWYDSSDFEDHLTVVLGDLDSMLEFAQEL